MDESSSNSRNEDPRLLPRRSSRSSFSLSLEDMELSLSGDRVIKSYDCNSNVSKNSAVRDSLDNRSLKRKRSQTSLDTCDEELLAVLSPKAPSESSIPVQKSRSPQGSAVIYIDVNTHPITLCCYIHLFLEGVWLFSSMHHLPEDSQWPSRVWM